MATLITSVTQSDTDYINKVLQDKPELVPHLAAWLRDGKLERAIKKQAAGSPNEQEKWAETCFYISHVGVKIIKGWLAKWNAEFETVALMDSDIKLPLKEAQRFVQFALGVHLHCWLPDLRVDLSDLALQNRYETIGRRLGSVNPGSGWQTQGYFGLQADNISVVVCLVDTARPKRSVQLPFTHEQMRQHSDWTFVDNWSRDAYLQSLSADVTYRLAPRFEKAFPNEWEKFVPLELESFEKDGVSAPQSFINIGVRGRNVKKVKGKGGLLGLAAATANRVESSGGGAAASAEASPPQEGNGSRPDAPVPAS